MLDFYSFAGKRKTKKPSVILELYISFYAFCYICVFINILNYPNCTNCRKGNEKRVRGRGRGKRRGREREEKRKGKGEGEGEGDLNQFDLKTDTKRFILSEKSKKY